MRVLVVEDEADLRRSLVRALSEEGFAVDEGADGDDGLHLAVAVDYDAIVLDLMLPGRSGASVLEALRQAGKTTPVLVLTARDAMHDRVTTLNNGADDYITKPFALVELVARLHALIRRAHQQPFPVIGVGEIEIDLVGRRVRRLGREVSLTARELSILLELVRHRGRVLTRVALSDHVYNDSSEIMSNAIDVHVAALRRKLGASLIETRRGLGYMIDA